MAEKRAMEETETHNAFAMKRRAVELCEELILEILLRLTAKHLFRSKSVCRLWRHLISDQVFLNSFIRKSKSHPPLISGFFCDFRTDNSGRGYPKFLDTSNSTITNHALRFLTCVKGPIEILDSNNGVLLCREKPKKSIILLGTEVKPPFTTRFIVCNPFTKQWVTLPETRQLQTWDGILMSTYNIAPNKCEFAVVCLILESSLHLKVRRYTSETGIWEEYKMNGNIAGVNKAVLFNDCAYWLNKQQMVSVFYFKGYESRIGSMKFPREDSTRENSKLQVSGGCLCFIESNHTWVDVWILVNRENWILKDHITYNSLNNLLAIHPLDRNLFLFKSSSTIFLRRMSRGEWQVISDHQIPSSSISVKTVPYFMPAWPTSLPHIRNN